MQITANLWRRIRARLIDDWRVVAVHAWSVRLMLVAALLSGLEMAMPLLLDWHPLPPLLGAGLTFVVVGAALIARFIAQRRLSGSR